MRPPRTPGGTGGPRGPGSGPPRARPPSARPPARRGDAPQRPSFGRPPALDELQTNQRELRRHIPGGRLPKVPALKPEGPRPATGRRARGDVRAAAAVAAKAGVDAQEPQRIAKLLARAGVGSRRDIERMIEEGKIALKGTVLTTPATIVTSLEGITVEGREVAPIEATRLFRFHKPSGFLTTARDPGGRPTIFDVLPPGLPRLVPVGRLDMNTEGLLLMTTDGGLKRALELPVNAVSRRYRVRAFGEISQAALETLIEGITIDGMHYGPIDADIERRTGANLWLTMRLTEGKNREIRRVLEFLGLQVSRLIRTAYGPFELGDLPVRDADEIPAAAIATLRKGLGAQQR
ncbi:pseudouridine synthase [Glacieibacterium frigidum]|uniref:Pseudouridine synthase n=1 Tax=Glacieibacterium frigidum TaxID=2593303 RepID=A0A552UHU9_9SPHN|nr:pseudouridine synthase [Glacieibacterium frigidum]TRW17770.1 rRNA pseudouridine synthase [Glacieibacterium frigidum]